MIGIVPFYRRRALRLLPALYVVVLANALFVYFSHQWMHTEVPSIFSVLFYYSNYYSASASGPFTPALGFRISASVVTFVRRAVLFGLAVAHNRSPHHPCAAAHCGHRARLTDHPHRRLAVLAISGDASVVVTLPANRYSR